MNNIQNLIQSDNNYIEILSQLERQTQIQETKNSGWRFDRNILMTECSYKTSELNGSSYMKIPLCCSALLNFENNVE